jgi:hypothetical protein
MREGVIHWALGAVVWNDPESPGRADKVYDFAAKTGLPGEHGYHLHSYFNTYKVHLRNTEKWVTLVERGRLASLENPELRALASRYGDPNEVVATLWVPEVAGINTPGKYEDYAANPYMGCLGNMVQQTPAFPGMRRGRGGHDGGSHGFAHPPAGNQEGVFIRSRTRQGRAPGRQHRRQVADRVPQAPNLGPGLIL